MSLRESIVIDIHNSPKLDSKNIEDESRLKRYTDDHFINKLNDDLEKIRNCQVSRSIDNLDIYENNSPILLSNENSDNDEEFEEYEYEKNDEFNRGCHKGSYKKLTVREIERSLNQYYDSTDKYSSELDILSTYLKGQKNLFIKSQYITQVKLHLLMIPSLIGTAIITVFAPIIQGYSWSGAFISGLNTAVALAMSIIHYLKLESFILCYNQLASQYDKMENLIEFTGNRISFIENKVEKGEYVLQKMTEIENKMNDMKDTTSIIIPNEIKRIFPVICHVNIFSFIKRIEIYKKNLMMKLKDIKNEIGYIEFKWGSQINEKQKLRLSHLYQIKAKLKDEIIYYKNAYSSIDELFIKEIQVADQLSLWSIWFYKIKKSTSENPVLKEYLAGIFLDV